MLAVVLFAVVQPPPNIGSAGPQNQDHGNSTDGYWIGVSVEGAPGPRDLALSLKVGQQALILGGRFTTGRSANSVWLDRADGRFYDPMSDTWSVIPSAPFPYSALDTAVWTGEEVLLWPHTTRPPRREREGLYALSGTRPNPGEAAAFSPAAGEWSLVPSDGLPDCLSGKAVWAGSAVLVWGNCGPPDSGLGLGGARYTPTTRTWSRMNDDGAPPSGPYSAIWTGREAIFWSAQSPSGDPMGAKYDPVADVWTRMSLDGAPRDCIWGELVWTDRELIVLCSSARDSNAAYDPDADRWHPISMEGGPTCCSYPPVWSGHEVIVINQTHGARYDPVADAWKPVPDNPELSRRQGATSVWDGTGVLVWGGARLGPLALFDDGFRYIPPGH
jgi:hypothetical protein